MFRAIANVFRVAELRARLAYTLALLAVYRLGVFINTPGVDRVAMNQFMQEFLVSRLKSNVISALDCVRPILQFDRSNVPINEAIEKIHDVINRHEREFGI